MKKLKLLAGLSSILVLLLSASVVDAKGGRWSGIDPEVRVNDQTVNVWVGWPSAFNCSVEGASVRFYVPKESEATLIAESNDALPCNGDGEDGFILLKTRSEILEKFDHNMVSIGAKVEASRRFPVRVYVYLNGEVVEKCGGVSNRDIRCGRVNLDDRADSSTLTSADDDHDDRDSERGTKDKKSKKDKKGKGPKRGDD